MRIRNILLIFIAILFNSLIYISCSSNDIQKNNKKIIIVTYLPHMVLDEVVDGIKIGLKKQLPDYSVSVFNPNGNLTEIQSFLRTLNNYSTQIIITVSTPATQAAISARHPSIPLVYSFVSDPSALDIDDNSDNLITGISNQLDYKKGIDLVWKIFPQCKRIGILYNPSESNSVYSHRRIVSIISNSEKEVTIISRQFSEPAEIQSVISTMPDVDIIYVGGDNLLVSNIGLLLSSTNNRKIPVFASDEGSVREGAVAAFSIDYERFGIETAHLVKDVLDKKSISSKPVLYSEGRAVLNISAMNEYGFVIPDNMEYEIVE